MATSYPRTLVKAVQRIIRGVGESAPTSVAQPTPTTQAAIDAVNDAVAYIWGKARWDFRLHTHAVDVGGNLALYELPSNFGEVAYDWTVKDGTVLMRYVDWQDLLAQNPDMYLLMTGSSGASSTDGTASLNYQAEKAGTPEQYSIFNNSLVLWPPPTTEWATAQGTIVLPYYKDAAELTGDSAEVPLPTNLLQAHHSLALSYLKQHLEHDDFQASEARGERLLSNQLARRVKKKKRDLRFRPRA